MRITFKPRGVFWRDVLRRRMLAIADALAAVVAIGSLGYGLGDDVAAMFWAAIFLPLWIVLAKLHDLYDRDHRALRHLTVDELPRIAVWALTSTIGTMGLLRLTPVQPLGVIDGLRVWAVAAVSVVILRGAARSLWRRLTPPEAALVVGDGFAARSIRRKIELFRDIHVRIVDAPARLSARGFENAVRRLPELERLILATPTLDDRLLASVVGLCRDNKIKLSVVPPGHAMSVAVPQLRHVAELPLMEYNTWDPSRSTLFLKRMVDLVVSAFGLLVLIPLFGLIALLIKVDSRGPIVFAQTRAGLGGRPYRMLKFRTMVPEAEDLLCDLVPFDGLEKPVFKLEDDPRVTRVGRVLRKTSLDELPQLLNVLKGEMSLVGPRPEQIELVERYSDEHRFRLAVKPGMTGPMQVYGRGQLTFEERLSVEREYVENMSIARDLRILALTVAPVVSGRGAF